MAKNIPVGRSMRLQVRLEMFNAFNNVNDGQPNATFGAATSGASAPPAAPIRT